LKRNENRVADGAGDAGDVDLGEEKEMKMTTQEILRACCAEESTRFCIDNPFVQGDYVVATNGHIAARLPVGKCDWLETLHSNGEKVPPIMSLPWDGKQMPAIPLPCVPEKTPMEPCQFCGGGLMCVCECGHEHTCGECDGKGVMPVPEGVIDIGPVVLAVRYIRLLQSFGVTEVVPMDSAVHMTRNMVPVLWRVGDVTGLLMPCSKQGVMQ
jgi:hypothetical protein